MIKNKMLEKIANSEKLVGAFSVFGSSASIECMGIAGLDFVIIDAEHGPWDVESTLPQILAAERRDIVPLVRVKDASRSSILKMLDIGAKGLLIPSSNPSKRSKRSSNTASMSLSAKGVSAAAGRPALGTWKGAEALRNTLRPAIGDADHPAVRNGRSGGVHRGDRVASGRGRNLRRSVRSFDCSRQALKFSDPEFVAAVDRTIKACKDAGKFCFTVGMNGPASKENFARGFDGVVSADISFLTRAHTVYKGREGINTFGVSVSKMKFSGTINDIGRALSMEKTAVNVTNIQAPPPGPLGKSELYALSVGNVIGSRRHHLGRPVDRYDRLFRLVKLSARSRLRIYTHFSRSFRNIHTAPGRRLLFHYNRPGGVEARRNVFFLHS